MTGLRLHDVTIASPTGRLRSVSCELNARRTLLVGKWTPLTEHLAGLTSLRSGRIEYGARSGRQAVIEGLVGVTATSITFPRGESGQSWLELGLGVRGTRHPARRAQELLRSLSLVGLKSRRVETMAPAELFALRLALAIASEPDFVMAVLPNGSSDAGPFLEALLGTVEQRARLALICEQSGLTDPPVGEVLELDTDGSLLEPVPAGTPRRLRLLAVGHLGEFVSELERVDVLVEWSGETGSAAVELRVTLPDGQDTRVVTDAAATSRTALIGLVALGA